MPQIAATKLFAVYLGGRRAGCHIELHDVRFVVGLSIDDTLEQLRSQWIGDLPGLHIDAFVCLDQVDGYFVHLSREKTHQTENLYFVNLGGYDPKKFTELHEVGFFVAESPDVAKVCAKQELLRLAKQQHKDDLFDVDDCVSIATIGEWHVHLTPGAPAKPLAPDWWGYRVIA